jgi:hypothetical protein
MSGSTGAYRNQKTWHGLPPSHRDRGEAGRGSFGKISIKPIALKPVWAPDERGNVTKRAAS